MHSLARAAFLLVCILGLAAPAAGAVELVSSGDVWSYWDQGGLDASPDWSAPGYPDSGWATGPSQLGYGDGDEATVVGYGSDPANRHITTYFRHSFSVDQLPSYLVLDFKRDDGIVVTLNGTEILRENMPTGSITSQTLALGGVIQEHEPRFVRVALDPEVLVVGDNLIAAEVHQASPTSPDISFDVELLASDVPFEPQITRGPYIQMPTPTSVRVRWRTDLLAESVVGYGPEPGDLGSVVTDQTLRTEHEVTISELLPASQYTYSVGTPSLIFAGDDEEHRFFTPPPPGVRRPVRIWAIGDSGSANQLARDVLEAYVADAGGRSTDVWLMLGDNAYQRGTDLEHQAGVFETFAPLLRRSAVWPSIGNHDAASSDSPTQTGPYFDAFTLPDAGQAGGTASGTEAYYSFDFANVHFVALDSEETDLSPAGAMASWLAADLASTAQDWTIAFFHRPPYSKGTHDSDTEGKMIAMRANLLPILEAGGVDLVLTGHSHAYERSFLVDGHYGPSNTLTPDMILDAGDGDPSGDGAYQKGTLGPAPHEGAIFVVAGSSSAYRPPGTNQPALDHPVMVRGENLPASLVLEIDRNVLNARALDEVGAVLDRFQIVKPTPPAECADGIDNDADGLIDSPADPGCFDPGSIRENPACDNGIDDDGDGWVDGADPHCFAPWQVREYRRRRRSCGIGFELAGVLLSLSYLRRTARRHVGSAIDESQARPRTPS